MFLRNFKTSFVQSKSIHTIRRSITSTTCQKSTKPSLENIENKNIDTKDVETYRPLTEDEIQKIVNLDNIHIVTKFQQKLPQRPPLIKDFFIGKIDIEQLTYPQVMEVKDFNEMIAKLQPITNYFADSARTPAELRFRDISGQMISDFKSMKLFGSSVHQRFAGNGYFKSEMNMASECEAQDIKSFLVLAGHRLAVEAISDHGDISQHNQYLMDIAKGDVIGAVCLHDPLSKKSTKGITVSESNDGDFVLNGSKSFAICSQYANVLIVAAEKSDALKKADFDEDDDEDEFDFYDEYMFFVLDPKSSGITYTDSNKTIGCNEVPFTTITFSNVRVGKDQILSEGIDDRKISDKLIASSRLQTATLNMVQAKNILNSLIDFSIKTKSNSEKLRDLQYIRENLAKIGCDLYGLESMIYLTAGIIDKYDNPKVDLECAITKAYSQDILQKLTEFSMNMINTPVTIASHPVGLDIRNAIQLQYNESSSILKSYVGRVGLRHAADHFGNRVEDYKDSGILFKLGFGIPKVEYLAPKNYLGDYLHPTLMEMADYLDTSIQRLRFSSEMILSRYKDSLSEREVEIENLGHIVMQNFATFASLGRSSRAYCIGLRYGVHETVAAACLVQENEPKITEMALEIKENQSGYHDMHKKISEIALERYRNKSTSVPSVLQSGVIQKIVK